MVLPDCVMLPEPDTTWAPVGWLVALSAALPQAGDAHGEDGGAACARGESTSEIAAANAQRFAIDLECPDLPLPLPVSATATQTLLTSLEMR